MPYEFEFDSANHILRGRATGLFTDEELRDFYRLVGAHFARIHPKAVIADFSGVTSFQVSLQMIRELAGTPAAITDPGTPRFIAAPAAKIFGFARMFEMLGARPSLRVVKSSAEAHAILDLPEPQYEPLAQEA